MNLFFYSGKWIVARERRSVRIGQRQPIFVIEEPNLGDRRQIQRESDKVPGCEPQQRNSVLAN